MKIILNNRNETIDREQVTVNELLAIKNFTWKLLVIKVNGILVQHKDYDSKTITEGDDVSVFHLVTGG
ncbi:MAG: sulfur carrier protein ThiS [Lentimicrobiaceae bacterium]